MSRVNAPSQFFSNSVERHQTTHKLPKSLLAVAIVLLALVFSCGRQSGDNGSPDRSTIKIGFFGDLSGPTFNFGKSAINGVLLAADEINQGGGINHRRIDVVYEDDKGSPEEAARLTAKLIDQDKVLAIIGGGTSANSRAAAPKAQSFQVPLIAPSSTDPAVTQTCDYIFRACFVDTFQGEVMASFAIKTLKAQKAAILYDFNSPYGRGLTEYFRVSFTNLGGRIVSEQTYAQGDADFKGQLSTIRAAEPDVIYIPGYYGDVALIAKQARMIGMKQPLLGGDGWDAPELWQLGGDALNGAYISTHYSVDDPSPAIQAFVSTYKQRYGNQLPDAHAALAYDAARILFDAMVRGSVTDRAKLRDALAQTKNFPGVTGIISIDANRNAIKPAVVLKLQDLKLIYQETIQPEASRPPSN